MRILPSFQFLIFLIKLCQKFRTLIRDTIGLFFRLLFWSQCLLYNNLRLHTNLHILIFHNCVFSLLYRWLYNSRPVWLRLDSRLV